MVHLKNKLLLLILQFMAVDLLSFNTNFLNARLDVNGNVNISGTLTLNNNSHSASNNGLALNEWKKN